MPAPDCPPGPQAYQVVSQTDSYSETHYVWNQPQETLVALVLRLFGFGFIFKPPDNEFHLFLS